MTEALELDLPARNVGGYELLLPLGSGGAATVYLARRVGLGGFEREVALKLAHPTLREDPASERALLEEAKLAGLIRHPNVVPVLDVGVDPAGVYLVMEYVEGESLASLVRLGVEREVRLPVGVGLRILCDVLEGLHAAHELRGPDGRGLRLVHRDVTPHNVLVGVDGCAKLTDFGIAKSVAQVGRTSTGSVKGKVAYMSPEQALGEPLDRRSDLWAVGVMAWELLTGMRMHSASSDAAVLLRIVSEPPPRPSSVRPGLPPELDELVMWALARAPGERPATARDLSERMAGVAREICGRASRAEVGAWVTALASQRLEARRARGAGAGRAELDRALEASRWRPRGAYDAPTAVEPRAAAESPPRLVGGEHGEATRTETASVSASRPLSRSRRGTAAIAVAVAGATLAAGAILRDREGDPPPREEPSGGTGAARSGPEPAAEHVTTEPTVQVSDLPVLPSAPPSQQAPPTRAARTAEDRRGARPVSGAAPLPVDLDSDPPQSGGAQPPRLLGNPYRGGR